MTPSRGAVWAVAGDERHQAVCSAALCARLASWGVPLKVPTPGAVLVYSRTGGGHGTLYESEPVPDLDVGASGDTVLQPDPFK
jgi:hypothetical protein